MKKLFDSCKIRNTIIKNRIDVPPMVNLKGDNPEGLVNDHSLKYYERLKDGNFGIVTLEALVVDPNGKLALNQLGVWNDQQIDGYQKIAKMYQGTNTILMAQLHHAGVMSVIDNAISASDIEIATKTRKLQARAMSIDEIKMIEQAFINAALRIEKAGINGVELHGAHNYLLSQFLNDRVNKRNDDYGQDHTLIIKNIVNGIRAKANKDFIIGIRMGAFEPTLNDAINHARIFEEIGMDYLSVSHGFSFLADEYAPENYEYAEVIFGASEIKKEVNIPVFAVEGIKTHKQANDILALTNVDMVCIGRATLQNPKWAII